MTSSLQPTQAGSPVARCGIMLVELLKSNTALACIAGLDCQVNVRSGLACRMSLITPTCSLSG